MNLLKSKTVWTGALGVLGAVAGYATGEMNIAQAAQLGVTSLLGIFLRAGIDKAGG